MNNNLLLTLNKDQKQAVFCDIYKLIKIIAGAGSGKTTILVERFLYIREKLNVSFPNILCIAYNTRAVKNIQEKVKKRLNISDNVYLSNIATFHSFCLNNVLREYFKERNVTVLDDDVLTLYSLKRQAADDEFEEYLKINDLIYNKETFNTKGDDLKKTFEEMLTDYYDYFFDNCHKKLSELFASKNFFVRSWPDTEKILFGLNFIYFKKKFHASIHEISVDYFDIILLSKLILERNLQFAKNLTTKFPYILIDEFQDIDEIQYEIIELLIKTNNIQSLFVVGDPDQCIYEWRRANINLLLTKIDKNYQKNDIKTIILAQNYRSGAHILKYANSLIDYNRNRYKKNLFSLINNGKVFFQHFMSLEDELEFVCERIKEILNEKQVLPKNIICVTRSNASIPFLEKHLINKQIKYQVYRANNFLNKKIIKSAMYCLLFMAKKSKLYFQKLLETKALSLNVGEKTIVKFINSSFEIDDLFWNIDNLKIIFQPRQIKSLNKFYLVWQEYLNKSEKLATKDVLSQFFQDLDFFQFASPDQKVDLNIFIEELVAFSVPNYNLEKIVDHIENCFISGIDSKKEDDDKIIISTIHQAKGLEFNTVFLFHLTRLIYSKKPTEEERRIFFVALTRAMNSLFVTSSNIKRKENNFFNVYDENYDQSPYVAEMRTWEIKDNKKC